MLKAHQIMLKALIDYLGITMVLRDLGEALAPHDDYEFEQFPKEVQEFRRKIALQIYKLANKIV